MDLDRLFRQESGCILSTLIGLLGDFDLAEEALQEAFTIAVQQWPERGVPDNPRAWLVSTFSAECRRLGSRTRYSAALLA